MSMECDEKTRLSYWFPIIEAAGFPVPKTSIVKARGLLWEMLDGKVPAALPALDAEIRIAACSVGVPFFLRTDYTSGKHDWEKTCYVADCSKLRDHIYALCEFSACADFMGLPTDVWVVREMLNTRPLFRAFHGRMPITREFRFFVRDGTILTWQPYWPKDSILRPDDPNWEDCFAELSRITAAELADLSKLSVAVNRVLPGYWSVDWLLTVDRGWVLTDMAEGERSFSYPHAMEVIA